MNNYFILLIILISLVCIENCKRISFGENIVVEVSRWIETDDIVDEYNDLCFRVTDD
jgi:hypothetical protein